MPRSPVCSLALTVATSSGGNRPAWRASAADRGRPSSMPPTTSRSTARRPALRSLRASVRRLSMTERPALISDDSSYDRLAMSICRADIAGAARLRPAAAARGRHEMTSRPRLVACRRAAAASTASSVSELTPAAPRTTSSKLEAMVGRFLCASPRGDVGGLARTAGLAVLAVGQEVVLAVLARRLVDVARAPGVQRNGLLQVRAGPLVDVLRTRVQRLEPLLGRRIAADVQPIFVQRLLERVDLRLRDLRVGLAHLIEVAWRHEAREQADDHDHHQQLQQ